MEGTNVMIDLETCGTDPNSAILSIGAQVFTIKDRKVQDELGPTFYVVVDFKTYDDRFTISPATILWWMEQTVEARREVFLAPNKIPIQEALRRFVDWCSKLGPAKYWSQGKDFDIVLLETAMKICDIRCPWKYWETLDTRTVYAIANLDYRDVPLLAGYPAHHALGDCLRQIRAIRMSLEKI